MKKLTSTLLFIVLFLNLIGCTPTIDSRISKTIEPLKTTNIITPLHVEEPESDLPRSIATPTDKTTIPSRNVQITPVVNGRLKVHFIDVGQADSIFIQTPENKAMLIDAGDNADGNLVASYIKSLGINKLNVLVGTHPHEDHIGGLDTVINSFDVDNIYMPKVSTNSGAFDDVLNAIENNGLKVTTAKAGVCINFDSTLKTETLAPNSDSYDDHNNYSAVIKLTYNNTSFLFTGDAESISEKEIISAGFDLNSDLLKVSHHGSGFSTGALFLKKVSPKYAVISVGENNSYNHPDNIVLNRLATYGVETFRTDKVGTIFASSDGNTIKLDKNASPVKPQAPPEHNKTSKDNAIAKDTNSNQTSSTKKIVVIVYTTKTGEKYHNSGCQYLKKSKLPLSLDDAKRQGLTPCSKCHPPQ